MEALVRSHVKPLDAAWSLLKALPEDMKNPFLRNKQLNEHGVPIITEEEKQQMREDDERRRERDKRWERYIEREGTLEAVAERKKNLQQVMADAVQDHPPPEYDPRVQWMREHLPYTPTYDELREWGVYDHTVPRDF